MTSLKNEILTFIPEIKEDPDNGEIYVQKLFCLEQDRTYSVPMFLTPKLLPGFLQMSFPECRVIINPDKD